MVSHTAIVGRWSDCRIKLEIKRIVMIENIICYLLFLTSIVWPIEMCQIKLNRKRIVPIE